MIGYAPLVRDGLYIAAKILVIAILYIIILINTVEK